MSSAIDRLKQPQGAAPPASEGSNWIPEIAEKPPTLVSLRLSFSDLAPVPIDAAVLGQHDHRLDLGARALGGICLSAHLR